MSSAGNDDIVDHLTKKLTDRQKTLFGQTQFGIYLNIPKCTFQAQFARCFMTREIEQDNPNEFWILVNETILKFTLLEFALITGLKCTGSEGDFDYTNAPTDRLKSTYFPEMDIVKKRDLIKCFHEKRCGDNDEDAVKIAILYFIHTFIFSQQDSVEIEDRDFHLVDGRYTQFPWGRLAFQSLIKSIRQSINPTQKMYRLTGMPYALQIWFYECCSEVDEDLAVHEDDFISRILNWRMVKEEVSFNCLMKGMFKNKGNKPHEVAPEPVRNVSEAAAHEPSNRNPTTAQQDAHSREYSGPLKVAPLKAVQVGMDTEIQFFISDSSLPSQIPLAKITLSSEIKTPAPRTKKPSRYEVSPYITEFGSSSKGKDVQMHTTQLKYPFQEDKISGPHQIDLSQAYTIWLEDGLMMHHEKKKDDAEHHKVKFRTLPIDMDFVLKFVSEKNWFYRMSMPGRCWNDEHMDVVFYYLRKKAKLQSTISYRYTTGMCLFKLMIDDIYHKYQSEDLNISVATQDDSMCSYIKGLRIPAGLPRHLDDEVYIPMNCRGKIHWVLAIVALRDRCIRVYDSYMAAGHKAIVLEEIKKFATLLPHWLSLSNFYDNTDRTDCLKLEAYNGKTDQDSFDIHWVSDIVQQKGGSMDCGVYVASFAEFLSDGEQIPSSNFDVELQRVRYGALLWNYGGPKASSGLISDNDDPPKPPHRPINPDPHDIFNVD